MSDHIEPCDRTHAYDEPCSQRGRIEDDPNAVLVDDLSHADIKGLFAGIGLSLTTPKQCEDDSDGPSDSRRLT
jgi:hypothetical protein